MEINRISNGSQPKHGSLKLVVALIIWKMSNPSDYKFSVLKVVLNFPPPMLKTYKNRQPYDLFLVNFRCPFFEDNLIWSLEDKNLLLLHRLQRLSHLPINSSRGWSLPRASAVENNVASWFFVNTNTVKHAVMGAPTLMSELVPILVNTSLELDAADWKLTHWLIF